MLIWKEIQKQLISYCERNSIDVIPQTKYDADPILKAFLSGYILNTAFLQRDGSYRTSFSHHVHPECRSVLILDCLDSSHECIIPSGKTKENGDNHVSRIGTVLRIFKIDVRWRRRRNTSEE